MTRSVWRAEVGTATANDLLVGTRKAHYPIAGATADLLYGTNADNSNAGIDPGCRVFNTPAGADVTSAKSGSGWRVIEACGGPTAPDHDAVRQLRRMTPREPLCAKPTREPTHRSQVLTWR